MMVGERMLLLRNKNNNMKYGIAILLALVSFGINAQEVIKKTKSNEIKLNVFNTLIFKSVDVTYEYLLNDASAVGLSFFANMNNEFNDGPNYNEKIAVTPYYRHYFSRKYAMGFFMEAFGMFNTQEIETIYYYPESDYESNTGIDQSNNFALGFALGGKFVSSRGFIFEFFGGIGRNLFTSSDYISTEFVPRLGINLGYRF